MKVVLASNNAGKIRELQNALQAYAIELIPQSELGIEDAIENGLSFIENALIKARHASLLSGLPALADDSGLAVDYLQGEPGIYSARYAGNHASSPDNIKKLLDQLNGVPLSQRQASFHCVLAFMRHAADPTPIICDGKWSGTILEQPIGKDGFGYDPIFFDPTYQQSAAELSLEQKNKISHRGQALALLLKQLADKP